MKKSLRKPINWQDFESLCKMLWGEIWKISEKIKKNGRLGQPQAGVDVYGVPKDKTQYSGIQCKGKDDYAEATLTEKEINKEIEKAKTFQPNLETFIFATTANKDASIEEFIRKKDLESRENGGFEILIYCWEDIADLIEMNRHTFNYYVLQNQFKSNYEIEISFSDSSNEFTLHPKFKKKLKVYKLRPTDLGELSKVAVSKSNLFHKMILNNPASANINHSWTSFELNFKNTGSMVLEDFKLYISPEENNFRDLHGYSGGVTDKLFYLQHSNIYVYEDEKYAVYRHKDNSPLIQKDGRSFTLYILTKQENYKMKIAYELLARDFNQEGELILNVEPEYEIEEDVIWVDNEEEVREELYAIEDILKVGSLF